MPSRTASSRFAMGVKGSGREYTLASGARSSHRPTDAEVGGDKNPNPVRAPYSPGCQPSRRSLVCKSGHSAQVRQFEGSRDEG